MPGATQTRRQVLLCLVVLLPLLLTIGAALQAQTLILAGSPLTAQQRVLQQYVGDWKVYSETLQPQPSTDTYDETYTWVLNRQYIQGHTGRRADGSEDLILGSYDRQQDGYPFWMFSSSGSSIQLAPGQWDGVKRTLTWESPDDAGFAYLCRCQFPDNSLRRCDLIVRNLDGTVLLERSWRAERRRQNSTP